MKLTSMSWLLVTCFMMSASSVHAAISPTDLIKVDNQIKTNCVEYYNYQGEMYCSTKAFDTAPPDADIKNYEKQGLVFDERAWRLAWGKKTSNITTIEYVPMGDDINNWHELVTSQFFPGLQKKTTPRKFADTILKGIEESGFKPIVTFIKESPEQVLFEFRIEDPANQIQDELQMITKGKDGLYVVHYVIKEKDMGQKNRDKWVKNLSQVKIQP